MADRLRDLTTRELLDEMRRRLRETHPDMGAYVFKQLLPDDMYQPLNEHHQRLVEVTMDWLEAEFAQHRRSLHSDRPGSVEDAIDWMSERLEILESKR
ncbi:hypothetical protein FGK63_20365 [Ruegeria sediminis]|uniref:Uncharacterized protein n=1 Tax=Ruegeria sediminis TaxID=2583820 RepID=A0ABY2WS20_9RHOB|nr:hypothetical protein [Ruegeria sediminis]TMV02584.1 hypothetical protein FGK63_20365 [Ruegeria sediminis]